MNGPTSLEEAAKLWPTPDAMVMSDTPEHFAARVERMKAKEYNGNGAGITLAVAAQEWGTPQAHDRATRARRRHHGIALADQAMEHHGVDLANQSEQWRSPNAQDGEHAPTTSDRRKGHQVQLAHQVGAWATPCSRDAKGELDGKRDGGTDLSLQARTMSTDGKSTSEPVALNPSFVEALMGFPTGWTVLGPSATRASRRRRPSPSSNSCDVPPRQLRLEP